jgi:acyl carrier protein
MDTLDTIKTLAATQFGGEADAIDADAPFDQLGIDSLGFLDVLFEFEDKLGVSVPPKSVDGVRTLRQLAAAIDPLIAAKNAATG